NGRKRRYGGDGCGHNWSQTRTVSYSTSGMTWNPPLPSTFEVPGVFNFSGKAEAWSNDSACSDLPLRTVVNLTVIVEVAPVEAEASADPVCPGETVVFSASTYCPGGTYTWIGDVAGKGSTISAVFDDPGTYTATVVYERNGYRSSDSVRINVKTGVT